MNSSMNTLCELYKYTWMKQDMKYFFMKPSINKIIDQSSINLHWIKLVVNILSWNHFNIIMSNILKFNEIIFLKKILKQSLSII